MLGPTRHLQHPPRGFVLLLTLVLLTLAALAMLAVSRAAMARSQAADESVAELQRRWGIFSCESVLLPNVDTFLRAAEKRTQRTLAYESLSIPLGNQRFDVTISDESAKANVGQLMHVQGREQAELTIRRLSLASPIAGEVHLRWGKRRGSPRPESFGDVFDHASAKSLCDNSTGPSIAETLTCWGDGRVNIHRAPESVIKEVCSPVLNYSQIHELASLQKSDPDISVPDAVARLQIPADKQAAAYELLTDIPTCFSLWITCRSPRRVDTELTIDERSGDGWILRLFDW